MAGNEDRKSALVAELARARARMDTAGLQVRRELDLGAKLKRSFVQHRWVWIGGAAAIGLLVARRSTGSHRRDARSSPLEPSNAAKTGLALAIGKIAFDLLKPTLMKMALGRVEDYVRRYTRPED